MKSGAFVHLDIDGFSYLLHLPILSTSCILYLAVEIVHVQISELEVRLSGIKLNAIYSSFLRLQTLSKDDIRNPEISKKIAVKLVEFHTLDMPGSRMPKLWERLRLVIIFPFI